jgi:hypothetical protein
MTLRLLVAAFALACTTVAPAQAPARPTPVDDSAFGLAKGSVFDVATPKPFSFDVPGKLIPPPVATPTMIPHAIDAYLPLAIDRNACLGCHDKPAEIGRKTARGAAAPAPASHYVQKDGKRVLSGAQFNCTACHAPQADVPPLVGNAASPVR